MSSDSRYRGIFTALITPMNEDDSIDHASLYQLVKHQQTLGVQGFYVGGSTGEGFLLKHEERKAVLETVVRAAAGESTIIAHIGTISTQESIELAQHAKEQGVDAISAVVPFYYKTSIAQIQTHYESIMAAVDLPLIIYHYPGATGVSLSMDFYELMSRHPQCIGVKFTSLNLFEMQQIRARCGEAFLIYNGHDEIYAAGALTGADGAIGSTYNMMAPLFVEINRYAEIGSWQALPALQAEGNAVIAHMLNYDVIPYEKYISFLQGTIASYKVREPLKQLTEEERSAIRSYYESNGTLTSAARRG